MVLGAADCRRASAFFCITALAIGSLSGPARAADPDSIAKPLDRIGVSPALLYDGAIASVPRGGIRHGTTYLGNVHLQISVDGGRLVNLPGLTAFVDALDIHGGQPSAYAGDAQGVSAIEGSSTVRLYEAWLQYNAAGSGLSVLAGRYDLNTEFDRTRSGALFLNSSFGIGPEFGLSGADGPSIFPNTAVGFRFTYKPAPNIVWRTAVMDGVPVNRPAGSSPIFGTGDGLLVVSELAFLNRPGPPMPPGKIRSLIGRASTLAPYQDKLAVGGWYYTAAYDDLSRTNSLGQPVRHHGSRGAYLVADKQIYHSTANPDASVSAFIQAGLGDHRVNRFGSYVGAGIEAVGLWTARPADETGVALAVARNGSHFLEAQDALGTRDARSEIAVEWTYLAQIATWMALQPDAQYVIHPDTDPAIGNALVLQLQLEIMF